MVKLISGSKNPLIKNILLLKEKPAARKMQNRILIEGIREIRLALLAGFTLSDFVYCSDFISPDDFHALSSMLHENIEISEVTPEIYKRVAYRESHEGAIALAIPRRLSIEELEPVANPLYLVLESVEKPGNLGAILRTADAAGLDGVIICDPQTDIFNPNAIRSSIGCIFTVPVVTATTTNALKWFHKNGIRIFATALTATNLYTGTNLTGPCAIIMGTEATGLSDSWLEESDEIIKIPMHGKIDSMNVSTSAAVVVFEAIRQRNPPDRV